MVWGKRAQTIAAIIALFVAVKVGQDLYRWFKYADERQELQSLLSVIDSAGLVVTETGLRADRLQAVIDSMDDELRAGRREVNRYESHTDDGAVPEHLYSAYRQELAEYNEGVSQRNDSLEAWREVLRRNSRAVDRYNDAADSTRAVAERMGEPYYEIPSPAEIAVKHGLIPPP